MRRTLIYMLAAYLC